MYFDFVKQFACPQIVSTWGQWLQLAPQKAVPSVPGWASCLHGHCLHWDHGVYGWSSCTFAPFFTMYLCCRLWGNLFVVLSTHLHDTSLMHFCTDLFFWSFLSQEKVQAGNLQFGSLGAVRGDDAERRWWAVMGKGGGCWPKAWAGSATDIKAVHLVLPCLFGGCYC